MENASIPREPEPANKSRQTEFSFIGRNHENICSLTLAGVGFKFQFCVVLIVLPPSEPEIILILDIILTLGLITDIPAVYKFNILFRNKYSAVLAFSHIFNICISF